MSKLKTYNPALKVIFSATNSPHITKFCATLSPISESVAQNYAVRFEKMRAAKSKTCRLLEKSAQLFLPARKSNVPRRKQVQEKRKGHRCYRSARKRDAQEAKPSMKSGIFETRRGFPIRNFKVSVSAMPPCTQSFIPLPLPHEYNLNDMIASKRYESVWNTFLKELTRDSAVTLSSLQKKWHVNRSGMKQWMRDNGLSVKEAKKHIHECRHYAEEGQMLPLPATAGNLFLPMTTDQPALQPESCDILSGVSLVFPDGTQVNIRRGSAQAVMSFLKLYQREDLPCLD